MGQKNPNPSRELLPKVPTPRGARIRKIVYQTPLGKKREGWLVRIGDHLQVEPITEWHGIFPSEKDATRWARKRARSNDPIVYCKRCLAETGER